MRDDDTVAGQEFSSTSSAAITPSAPSTTGSGEGEQPPVKQQGALDLEKLSKMTGYLAIGGYAIGLIAVNSYLYQMGVSEFDLFKPRFITTGLLILLILGIATMGPAYAWASLNAGLMLINNDRKLPDKFHRQVSYIVWTIMILGGFIIGLFLPWAIFSGFMHISDVDDPWSTGWELYSTTAFLGGLITLAIWINRSGVVEDDQNRKWPAILIMPKWLPKPPRDRWTDRLWSSIKPPRAWTLSFGLLLFIAVYSWAFLLNFTEQVYPRVPEQFGGGKPRSVRLLIASDAEVGLRELELLAENKQETGEVLLLFQGSNFYVVKNNRGIFVLEKATVIAIRLSS